MGEFDLQPGSTISHFRLEKKLGEGGMGAVYLAEDLTLGRRVAIKFMSRALLAQQASPAVRENIEQRFIREARSAAAINHPNITQIFEANFDSDNWFIAMELVNGHEVADQVSEGRIFTVGEIIDIAKQTIEGLKHAWEEYKIIHRDIKPQNIMVTKSGQVKIVDLGLAKPIQEVDEDLPELTGAGVPIGTPHYMAPEQATGETNLDFRVDLFAIGATLYEISTRKKAFNGKTAPLIYMAQMAKKYPPAKELRPELPDAFSELLDRMLEPKLADRISTYDECLQVLEGLSGADLSAETQLGNAQTVFTTGPGTSITPTSGIGDHTHISTILGFSIGTAQYMPTDHLIVDRYRVLKPIGRSRAGIVYHCLDKQLGIECAVKSLLPGREFPAQSMPGVKANFQRLLSKSHPNLAQIRDLHEDPSTGELFVVMEMLGGRNLRDFTHRILSASGNDTLEWENIQPVLTRVAAAIDATNSALGFPHGDIKPESIFLTNNDAEVKLLDYGITEFVIPETTSITEPVPLANSDYMAPEVWQMRATNARADQYAFAVVIWEMLGRRLPFWLRDGLDASVDAVTVMTDAETLYGKLRERVLNEPPPDHPEISGKIGEALNRGLAKDSAARYPSCTALMGTASGKGLPILPIAMAAAVIIIGGIVAVAASSGDDPGKDPIATGPDSPGITQPITPPDGPPPVEPPDAPPTPPVNPDNGATGPDTPAKPPATIVNTVKPPVEPPKPTPEEIAAERARKAAAEEAARAKQAAEAEALRKAKLEREARRLQEQFAPLREKLGENPYLNDLLADLDKSAESAKTALDNADYTGAARLYSQALENGAKLKAKGEDLQREEALKLKATVSTLRNKLKAYEGIDAKLAEKIVGIDVASGLANTHFEQVDFGKAVTQFKRAQSTAQGLLNQATAKYTPKREANFTLAKTNAPFIWIKELNGWVAKYETTNAQYRRFKSAHNSGKQEGFSMNGETQPVVEVSYLDAVAFCEWLNAVSGQQLPEGYRFTLPDKEQWLTVVRCATERLYPWGNQWPPPYGNYGNQEIFPTEWKLDGYLTDTHPVTCSVEKSGENEWGVAGLAGNVWEWSTAQKGNNRAVLGGSWTSNTRAVIVCQPKGDIFPPMDQPFDNIGFRIFILKTAQ